jgi:iron(III) transport system substrate-binding protein
MRICPHCNQMHPSNTQFCPTTGQAISEPALVCPHCNQTHPEGVGSCPITGKSVKEPPSCPQCGEKMESDWVVCAKCGNKRVESKKSISWSRSKFIWLVGVLLFVFVIGGLMLIDLPSFKKSNGQGKEAGRITLGERTKIEEDSDLGNDSQAWENDESDDNEDYQPSPYPLPIITTATEPEKKETPVSYPPPVIIPSPAIVKEKTYVVIYTAKEPDEVAEFIPIAQAALPDYTLDVLRLSTGDLTARLLAEKDNPQADVIWGTAVTSMMIFMNEGMLEPYAPKGWQSILPMFKDYNNPPYWVGVDGYVNAVICNIILMAQNNLVMPQTWEDLLDPAFEGSLVMPNPASSGTGYMFVASILQGMGEMSGWEYLIALDNNMAMYTKSGSAPARMAAAGEFLCSISFAFVGANLLADGAPINMVIPQRTGWDMEANALINGANNPAGAKAFLDWAISDEAFEGYSKYFGVLSKPGFDTPPGIPADIPYRLFPMDFNWSMENRDRILAEWLKLFEYKVQD